MGIKGCRLEGYETNNHQNLHQQDIRLKLESEDFVQCRFSQLDIQILEFISEILWIGVDQVTILNLVLQIHKYQVGSLILNILKQICYKEMSG